MSAELKNAITVPSIIQIRKRDGQIAPFNVKKITQAVARAFYATGEAGEAEADKISELVYRDLLKLKKVSRNGDFLPHVEMVQDLVEEE
ncbi:MAG: ATP cone domain-containing protein, partial [Patescibacteria group bacterium]